jgi:hypothetical protein
MEDNPVLTDAVSKKVSFHICVGEVRGAHNILVGRPEGRRPLERPRRRWEDNIKMDIREIGFGDVDSFGSG